MKMSAARAFLTHEIKRHAQRAAWCLFAAALAALAPAAVAARNHALLIGVADYDDPAIRPLHGPRNDVILMWRLLRARGFAPQDMQVLAEGLPTHPDNPAPGAPATRAAIMAGFERLAEQAAPGDLVVIHYSGHGTTQPEMDPDHDPEPEPGGRDQVLLPRDAGRYDPATRRIRNGIIDDEIGAALDRIRARGATVWAIVDACHAGTVTRSSGAATRAVEPAALGVPAAVPRPLAAAAPERGGVIRGLARKGSLVGFFAVDSWTEALERDLPGSGAGFVGPPGKQRFGVFTWHLARALDSSRARTFRDLARLVALDMAGRGALAQGPLPVFDGDLDLSLGGERTSGPRRFAARLASDGLMIEAGSLNGFDPGAEVGVFDGPAPDARRVGSSRVATTDLGASRATPAAGWAPDATQMLWAAVEMPGATFRFRIGLDDGRDEDRQRIRRLVGAALAWKDEAGAIAADLVENEPGDMQARLQGGRLWLVAPGQPVVSDPQAYDRSFSIMVGDRPDGDIETDLRRALWAFARAGNLIRLAGVAEQSGEGRGDIDITLERTRETDPARLADSRRACGDMARPTSGEPIGSGSTAAVSHCDQIRLSIANRGDKDLDIGVFFLNPVGEISVPVREWRQNGCVGYLPAKSTRPLVLRTTVRTWTDKGPSHSGPHRILVFALPRSGSLPPGLCHLLQPSAETARADGAVTRSAGARRGFAALLDRAALVDPGLRAANPFEDDPSESAAVQVRQFTLDIRPPPQARQP